MRAGVDIGGTFTDLCIAGPDGIVAIGKALGTPAAPARQRRDRPARRARARGLRRSDLTQVVHATTLVTNALIERKGAKVALLATAGFRDVIELARERRPDIYRLDVWRPEPLVPRHLRFDVAERTLADGTIEQAVDTRRGGGARGGAGRARDRGDRDLLPAQLRQPGQRAGGARGGRARGARPARRDLQRRRAGDPRVRAHADHGRERLRPGPRRALPGRSRGAAQRAWARTTACG